MALTTLQDDAQAGRPNMDLGTQSNPPMGPKSNVGPKVLGARRLFMKKAPGAPGKLGKSSTKAESLSKLRGKGAIP